jgi:3',5'-cyclic AMP phosphodiesterase CpdA
MRLLAISDLHVGYPANREAVERTPRYPNDWLIVAGDVGETTNHLDQALELLVDRFARIIWVPGNHELWTRPANSGSRGAQKYTELVGICRKHGAITPEDPYPVWPGEGGPHLIAPLFVLYDYSFAPAGMTPERAVAWASEHDIVCTDEFLLHPDPYPSRAAWCQARCVATERRLGEALVSTPYPTVLINHFPLRRELVRLPRIPRFAIWCGTERTRDWHTRFRAAAVVYGHLHQRGSQSVDGVRFEEVSLGYPRDWRPSDAGLAPYLRQILPSP